jgi:hypothetical protein
MVSPNRGVTSGATHQAGSQRVTVSSLAHPWPTFNVGQDEQSLGPPLRGTLFGGFGNLSTGSGTPPTHSLTCCVMIGLPGLPNWYCFSLTQQAHWPTFLIGQN